MQLCSFKHYRVDLFEQELLKLNFSNYQNYEINEAYNDFIQKIMTVIDKVALIKERQVKQNSQGWFDGVIDYLKSLKNQNYTLTKIFIERQDIKYGK